MASKIKVRLDRTLYDEAAVRETVELFQDAVEVSMRRYRGNLVLTFSADEEDLERAAGEFVNIALARTLEARAEQGG